MAFIIFSWGTGIEVICWLLNAKIPLLLHPHPSLGSKCFPVKAPRSFFWSWKAVALMFSSKLWWNEWVSIGIPTKWKLPLCVRLFFLHVIAFQKSTWRNFFLFLISYFICTRNNFEVSLKKSNLSLCLFYLMYFATLNSKITAGLKTDFLKTFFICQYLVIFLVSHACLWCCGWLKTLLTLEGSVSRQTLSFCFLSLIYYNEIGWDTRGQEFNIPIGGQNKQSWRWYQIAEVSTHRTDSTSRINLLICITVLLFQWSLRLMAESGFWKDASCSGLGHFSPASFFRVGTVHASSYCPQQAHTSLVNPV